jgi:hypothetical protein
MERSPPPPSPPGFALRVLQWRRVERERGGRPRGRRRWAPPISPRLDGRGLGFVCSGFILYHSKISKKEVTDGRYVRHMRCVTDGRLFYVGRGGTSHGATSRTCGSPVTRTEIYIRGWYCPGTNDTIAVKSGLLTDLQRPHLPRPCCTARPSRRWPDMIDRSAHTPPMTPTGVPTACRRTTRQNPSAGR